MSIAKKLRIIFFSCISLSLSSQGICGEISGSLRVKLSRLKPGETLPVVVDFTERPDLNKFTHGKKSAAAMIQYLKTLSAQNIQHLHISLSKQKYAGRLTPLWITNGVVLDVTDETARLVAGLPFVNTINEDETVTTDGSGFFHDQSMSSTVMQIPGWNINKIKADSVWQIYGINGHGVLIGSMDTGVDTTHPSLAFKWKGNPYAWFDAINGNPDPYDDLGHGTHTTGTLVGGDGQGPDVDDIGVAYGAKFIAAKMLSGGFATNSQVISGAQWMLDPDGNPATNDFPDVINNSWFSNTRGSTWFTGAAAAWRAAGIIPVFCAANFGPATESTRSPGDYYNCISVGGTNISDDRYGATSVGPSPVGSAFPSDRRKPDISAPAEGVRSSQRGGGFGLGSGTSMAAPHVAGTVALMLQANPDLTYDEALAILKQTSADLGASGYDYVFGYGRIDALEAVREALKYRIRVTSDNAFITHETGDSIILSIALRVPPKGNLTIELSLSDTTEGDLLSSTVIEFAQENWNVPQTILIRGKNDAIPDGDIIYALHAVTSSSDLLYDQLALLLASITNIDASVSAVSDDNDYMITGFRLHQNYPNPFNPKTVISYLLSVNSYVTVRIYDLFGREVAVLMDGMQEAGYKSVGWDASGVPGGMYYYRMSAGTFSETKKMLLLK